MAAVARELGHDYRVVNTWATRDVLAWAGDPTVPPWERGLTGRVSLRCV